MILQFSNGISHQKNAHKLSLFATWLPGNQNAWCILVVNFWGRKRLFWAFLGAYKRYTPYILV